MVRWTVFRYCVVGGWIATLTGGPGAALWLRAGCDSALPAGCGPAGPRGVPTAEAAIAGVPPGCPAGEGPQVPGRTAARRGAERFRAGRQVLASRALVDRRWGTRRPGVASATAGSARHSPGHHAAAGQHRGCGDGLRLQIDAWHGRDDTRSPRDRGSGALWVPISHPNPPLARSLWTLADNRSEAAAYVGPPVDNRISDSAGTTVDPCHALRPRDTPNSRFAPTPGWPPACDPVSPGGSCGLRSGLVGGRALFGVWWSRPSG
jgi:hypothetical protein